jgi:hypothetical protein
LSRALAELRARWSPSQRRLHAEAWALPEPPVWVERDPLRELWVDHERLLATGELTWGAVVMANAGAWKPGPHAHVAAIIYSFDPWFERDPSRLNTVAQRVFALREPPEARWPAERRVQGWVRDGDARYAAQPLPPSLAMGRAVDLSTALLLREHLPGGHLRGPVLLVLASRDGDPKSCFVVPAALWPTSLRGGE